MTVAVIIVAAGRGTRAGEGLPKQWRDLAGRPVLAQTVAAFAGLGRILVVLHPDDMGLGMDLLGGSVALVAGGATRSETPSTGFESTRGDVSPFTVRRAATAKKYGPSLSGVKTWEVAGPAHSSTNSAGSADCPQ